jgi:hypothetical protein
VILKRFYFDTALSSTPVALPCWLAFADPTHITFGSGFPYAPTPASRRPCASRAKTQKDFILRSQQALEEAQRHSRLLATTRPKPRAAFVCLNSWKCPRGEVEPVGLV